MSTNVLTPGWVTFAGAGPGAPDLLTIRCRNAIAEADIIVYAGSLVNPEVLRFAAPGCRLCDSAGMDLPAIAATLIGAARQGLRVLRLHTGDPALYGAITEQMAELDAAGVPCEIIPGVSAVFAAAAALRTELTLPAISQTLILSRRAGRTPVPAGEELAKLAAHGATLALYLSAGNMEGVTRDLQRGGYLPETPAAVVYRASWPDEESITGSLGTIAAQVRRAGISRQAVILVGRSLGKGSGPGSKLYDPDFSHGYRMAGGATAPTGQNEAAVAPPFFAGRIAVYALTGAGCVLARRLGHALHGDIFLARSGGAMGPWQKTGLFPFDAGNLSALLEENWSRYAGHLFIMATGIVVRKIAPLLKHKIRDPAVVVCDEKGRFAISLAGGHLAGANRLAARAAELLGGEAVISTATDVRGLRAFDAFAATRGMKIVNPENIKKLNRLLLNRQPIAWLSGQNSVPQEYRDHPFVLPAPGPEDLPPGVQGVVMIGTGMPFPSADIPVLHLQPQPLAVGIGCKRGTPAEEIQTALRQTLERHDLTPNRIRILASIALKEDEPGLLETARSEGWQTRFFSAGELERIAVPHPSPLVLEKTGSPSVAEAAALAAGDGRLLVAKEKVGAVTLAIATLTEAPDDKKNALLQVVGIGPGTLEGMTRQALEAIRNAKIIIGYQAYCDRIAALLPGKTVLSSGMREEIERCDQALDLAGEGRSVALICSGDAGVYGMAGLVFERIEARGLDFGQVRVIPGVTAASLAAAAVGAPLMNDFAVISLSDLLTDRATILRRLQHAAASGMACALYNPRSEKRRKLIQTALDLFIEERGKNTPGAIVSHAGRTEETLWTGRIADMPVEKIHMSSMVLIGGENCRLIGNRLVEPRGYAKKSGFLEGEGEEG